MVNKIILKQKIEKGKPIVNVVTINGQVTIAKGFKQALKMIRRFHLEHEGENIICVFNTIGGLDSYEKRYATGK